MHRLIAHRQFTGPAWLRVSLCALGAMAGEGTPLLWSAIHRLHHRDPDGDDDVHSPTGSASRAPRVGAWERVKGFVWAQCGWYGEVPGITEFRRALAGRPPRATNAAGAYARAQAEQLVDVVQDWRDDRAVLAADLMYPVWIAAGFVVPFAVGLAWGGLDGALAGVVWGGVVRFVVVQKVSFAINSVGHTIGARYLKTPDDSKNNVVMAALTLGSGWHNNHHAFPGSASLWFAPWHVDPCWLAIRVLEQLGIARDVRTVDRSIVEARRV
jgi:stearoyl-CoA desaturase (delta-9 desaturase)